MAAENTQSNRCFIVRPVEDYVEQFEQFVRYGDEMVKKEPRVAVMKEWYSDSAWEDIEERLVALFTEVTAYINARGDSRSSRHASLAGFLVAFGFDASEAQAAADVSLWVEHGGSEKRGKKQKQKHNTVKSEDSDGGGDGPDGAAKDKKLMTTSTSKREENRNKTVWREEAGHESSEREHEGQLSDKGAHLSGLTGCRSREDWSWKACMLELFRPAAWT